VGRKRYTVAEIMTDLQIPHERRTKALQMEIGKALKGLKWYRHVEYNPSTKKTDRFWADTPQEKVVVPF